MTSWLRARLNASDASSAWRLARPMTPSEPFQNVTVGFRWHLYKWMVAGHGMKLLAILKHLCIF
jgi:hypothetical protein